MALVPDQKFSTFQIGGDVAVNDIIVGLRGGLNTQFIYTGVLPAGVIVPIANGGTGASTAPGARSNLGLGTIATQDASAVDITGGTISGVAITTSTAALIAGSVVDAPVAGIDIANKTYVDAQVISGGTVNAGLINQMAWYAASGTVISGLATLASGVLVTSAGSVPSISTTLPAGLTIPTPIINTINDANGNPLLSFIAFSNAVNYIDVVNAATGGFPQVIAAGSDTNIDLYLAAKGNAPVVIYGASGGTMPLIFASGTSYQHLTSFNFSNTSATRAVTFPDADGTVAFTSSLPTPSPLTKTDDTNVTLTLGGFPTVALLAATSLTLGWTGQLGLTRGGSNASLTASNGGIVYSTASAMAILAGTATANLPLLSGSTAAPTWGSFAISLGGALTTAGAHTLSGAFASTFTFTNTTNVTFPTSGTLATTSQLPTPAPLTKTDDTNVTLALGGAPTTALLQATSLTLGWTGQLAVGRGGTGVASVTVAPAATAFAGWDANKNLSANNHINAYTTTVSSASPIVLTVSSTQQQFITGSTAQTVTLPVANTLVLGQTFLVVNNSSAITTVQSSGANTVTSMAAATEGLFTCILASGTSAASWSSDYAAEVIGVTSIVKQTFTGSGTYTPTTGMLYCVIECWGAGGGGGGNANTAANVAVWAAGGGAGGYSRTLATAATVGASQTVTIGALGAGGTSGNNGGSAGTATSVGSICIANGGTGGNFGFSVGGAGGTAGTGDIAGVGASGKGGASAIITTSGQFVVGDGASSPIGSGGAGRNAQGNGSAASGFGSGGGGGFSINAGGAVSGGNGAPGFVIITEYV